MAERTAFSILLNQLSFDDKIYPLEGVDRETVLRKITHEYPARVRFNRVKDNPISGKQQPIGCVYSMKMVPPRGRVRSMLNTRKRMK